MMGANIDCNIAAAVPSNIGAPTPATNRSNYAKVAPVVNRLLGCIVERYVRWPVSRNRYFKPHFTWLWIFISESPDRDYRLVYIGCVIPPWALNETPYTLHKRHLVGNLGWCTWRKRLSIGHCSHHLDRDTEWRTKRYVCGSAGIRIDRAGLINIILDRTLTKYVRLRAVVFFTQMITRCVLEIRPSHHQTKRGANNG